MAAIQSKVSFAADGTLCVIVHPTDDSEISGTKHNQPNMVNVIVDRALFQQSGTIRDQMALCQPLVAAINPAVGLAVTSKINAIDAAANDQASLG